MTCCLAFSTDQPASRSPRRIQMPATAAHHHHRRCRRRPSVIGFSFQQYIQRFDTPCKSKKITSTYTAPSPFVRPSPSLELQHEFNLAVPPYNVSPVHLSVKFTRVINAHAHVCLRPTLLFLLFLSRSSASFCFFVFLTPPICFFPAPHPKLTLTSPRTSNPGRLV